MIDDMPELGPDNRYMYSAYEAYDVCGGHMFGKDWSIVFAPGPTLLHPSAAEKVIELGGETGERQKALGDPKSDLYRLRQARNRRTHAVMSRLVTTLNYGKANSYQETGNGYEFLNPHEWTMGSDLVTKFMDDIAAVVNRNMLDPRRFLIDLLQFDAWIGQSPREHVDPLVQVVGRNRLGRGDALDYDVLRAELERRRNVGEFPEIERGWRSKFCRELSVWYGSEIDEDHYPSPKTLLKKFREKLDEIERRGC